MPATTNKSFKYLMETEKSIINKKKKRGTEEKYNGKAKIKDLLGIRIF